MVNQVELHPQLNQPELRAYCDEHDIQLEAWSPLARGKFFDDPIIQELSKKYEKTPAQIILRWDYQHGGVSIPKSSSKQRQAENANIFDFELSAHEMNKLESLNQDERIGPHPDEFDYSK